MENIYLLVWLNMPLLRAGYFKSEDEAWGWVERFDSDRKYGYEVIVIDRAGDEMSPRNYKNYSYQS